MSDFTKLCLLIALGLVLASICITSALMLLFGAS
jgi:hypothetical protein